MSAGTPDEPFFSRWSRQKQAGQWKPTVAGAARADDAPEVEAEIDPATLPKIEDLTAESDVSVFLRKGVPEALQKLALRRMWSLDPEIRNFVEMAENQWDFHAPGGIPGLFQELPAGSDVSVWLAQATKSVVRKEKDEQVAVADAEAAVEKSREHPAAQQEASAGQPADAADAPLPAGPADGDDGARQRAQPVEVATGSSVANSGTVQSDGVQPRRRHGGALPA